MAENNRRRRKQTAEARATSSRKKAEQDHAALDNPDVPDEPSEIRNTLYFVSVLVFAIVLNLLVLLAASGGR